MSEHIHKFALIYAASANRITPSIGGDAVRWATRLIMHLTRRSLYMARSHVAENSFHTDRLKLLQRLREAPDRTIPHSLLLKRMKVDSQSFQKPVQTLVQQGDVTVEQVKTGGRVGNVYRLATG